MGQEFYTPKYPTICLARPTRPACTLGPSHLEPWPINWGKLLLDTYLTSTVLAKLVSISTCHISCPYNRCPASPNLNLLRNQRSKGHINELTKMFTRTNINPDNIAQIYKDFITTCSIFSFSINLARISSEDNTIQ